MRGSDDAMTPSAARYAVLAADGSAGSAMGALLSGRGSGSPRRTAVWPGRSPVVLHPNASHDPASAYPAPSSQAPEERLPAGGGETSVDDVRGPGDVPGLVRQQEPDHA